MDIVEPSTDWIEFDAETDEVPFLHMHDMIEAKYINGIDLSSPVPAWSVDFDRSRDPVVAYRVVKKADASEIEQLRNDNNRLACLAIDNAKDTGRALMYRKILQQIADEGSGHGQALAYAALKEKE